MRRLQITMTSTLKRRWTKVNISRKARAIAKTNDPAAVADRVLISQLGCGWAGDVFTEQREARSYS